MWREAKTSSDGGEGLVLDMVEEGNVSETLLVSFDVGKQT